MHRPSRQAIVLGGALLLAGAGALVVAGSKPRAIDAGFWFEPIGAATTHTLPERLGEAVGRVDMQAIESIAFQEIVEAFRGFPVSVSNRREAAYRVRVVENLQHPMSPRAPAPSGESRAIPGLGGQGAVNFRLLAHNAVAYAPPEADRPTIIAAIGRGIGRAAVHEFAHQFLGAAPIHDSRDRSSYEYRSAARAEQYYGTLHWDIAGPLLRRRFRLE